MKISKFKVIALLATSSVVLGAETTGLVSPLPRPYAIEGCSWSASAPTLGAGFIYLAELDESRSMMRIDGTNVELRLMEKKGTVDKVGDVLEKTYSSGSIQVKARYVTTWVCPENDRGCEVTKYSVIFEVSKGPRTQIVKATGDVGC